MCFNRKIKDTASGPISQDPRPNGYETFPEDARPRVAGGSAAITL
jgi:hypothetical protein